MSASFAAAGSSRSFTCTPFAQAGAASDVWSLGCLLYELVTGRFLFHDPDWIRFFMRVTRDGGAVLPPDHMASSVDSIVGTTASRSAACTPPAHAKMPFEF